MRPILDTEYSLFGKGKLQFIDYMQIFGIILVIVGHSLHEHPDGIGGVTTLVYRMIYSFHMPMFLFISGFLLMYSLTSTNRQRPTYTKFFTGKFKRLIIPYLTLSIITFVPRVYMSSYADDTFELSLSSFLQSLLITEKAVIPYFWFIQSCFTLLLVCYAVIVIADKYRLDGDWTIFGLCTVTFALLIFTPVCSVNIFSINKTLSMCFYFCLGIAFCRWYDVVTRYLKFSKWWFLVISLAAWLISFYIFEYTYEHPVIAFFGIIMSISLTKFLVAENIPFFNHLSGAYYFIFLLSWYPNVATQQVLSHLVTLPWYVYTILSITLGIYFPWLIYKAYKSGVLLHKQKTNSSNSRK